MVKFRVMANTLRIPDRDLDMLRELQRHGVPFVIIGGHAVRFHGVQREVEDLDVAVDSAGRVEDLAKAILDVAGVLMLDNACLGKPGNQIPVKFNGVNCDILTWIEGVEFAEAYQAAHVVELEKTYQPNDKGEVYDQRMQIPMKNNIRFAFRAYARAHLVDYQLDIGDNRWNDFKNSILVRDRLTHPKEVRNLEVSDEELQCLQRAFDWFSECTVEVSDLAQRALESKLRAELPPEQMAQLDRLLETMK